MLSLTHWLGRMTWGSTTVYLVRGMGMRRLVVRPRIGGASHGSRPGERVVLEELKAFYMLWWRRFTVFGLEICGVVSLEELRRADEYMHYASICFGQTIRHSISEISCASSTPWSSHPLCRLVRGSLHTQDKKVPCKTTVSLASSLVGERRISLRPLRACRSP